MRQQLHISTIASDNYVHVVPVLLGHGARLFGDGPMTEWTLVDAAAGRHALHQTYRRTQAAPG